MNPNEGETIEYIQSCVTGITDIKIESDKSIHCNAKVSDILSVVSYFKDDPKMEFKTLIDIFGTDFPYKEERFEITYQFLSMKYNRRLYIKIALKNGDLVDSISSIFGGAVWYEREVWDMYGVMFRGNPDLRRILTDYGFQGHPLRKDFPLTGYVEVRYDMETKKVVYEPVNLTQEYRNFDFLSPWEGPSYTLPGDEKVTSKN